MSAERRLRQLGLALPDPPRLPQGVRGAFLPARRSGPYLYLSGMGPLRDGRPAMTGKVGSDLTAEEGYEAARLTTLNLLAIVRAELGNLDRVRCWVKVLGMVNSAPGFTEQAAVVNGCSDLVLDLFGDSIGGHARSAVGMAELPFDIPVEIEAILEVEPA